MPEFCLTETGWKASHFHTNIIIIIIIIVIIIIIINLFHVDEYENLQ